MAAGFTEIDILPRAHERVLRRPAPEGEQQEHHPQAIGPLDFDAPRRESPQAACNRQRANGRVQGME